MDVFSCSRGDFVEPLGAAGGEDHAREGGRGAGGEHAPRGISRGPAPFHAPAGALRRRLGGQRFEARLVGVVAVGAQQVPLVAVPVAGAAAVDAGAPVAVFFAVALAADAVGFVERDALAAGQVQEVAIGGVVAIQAPAVGFVVLENDVGVHRGELAARAVDGHSGVAVGAGEDALGEGRRRHFEAFRPDRRRAESSARPPPAGSAQTAAKSSGTATHSAIPPCAALRAATWPGRVAGAGR